MMVAKADRQPVRRRFATSIIAVILSAATLSGCADGGLGGFLKGLFNDDGRVARTSEVRPGGGYSMVGRPYQIRGRWYYPEDNPNYRAQGIASWYGADFHGRETANGEVYNMAALTAAHPTLPLPSYARVTNLENGRSVVVRINDRGPYAEGRVIDLSQRAARLLGYEQAGITRVDVDYIGRAPLDGLDENVLMASFIDPAAGTSSGRLGQSADTMLAAAAPQHDDVAPSPARQQTPTTMLALAPATSQVPAPVPPARPNLPSNAFTGGYFDPIAPLISVQGYLQLEEPVAPANSGAADAIDALIGGSIGASPDFNGLSPPIVRP